MLVCRSAGLLLIFTRVAGTSHCTLTQGWGVPLGRVNGQPAIVLVSAFVATIWPPTFTRVFDDAVEIFLNRPDAKDEKEYLQVIVNVDGVIFDAWRKDPKWDGDIQVATRRLADHWTLEVSIPLKEVGMSPADAKALRLNVVRDVFGAGPGKANQIEPWYPTTFGHGDLNLRGWLFFAGPH